MLGKNPPFITSDTLNFDFVGLEMDLIGLEIVLNAAARLELNVVLLLLGGVPVVGSGLVLAAPGSGMICMRKSVPAWGLLRVIMSLIMSISSLGELEGMDKMTWSDSPACWPRPTSAAADPRGCRLT